MTSDGLNLVPSRECGTCTVCCKQLTIDVPELKKLPGVLCDHCEEGKGCRIYPMRPPVCVNWYCGWRFLPRLDDDWRPDRSGILITFSDTQPTGLKFELVDSLAKSEWEPFVTYVAMLVSNNIPVVLAVPGPVGYASGKTVLNDGIMAAVKAQNYNAVVEQIRQAMAACVAHPKEKVELNQL
jgi:hypothetical protein